jgi:hypothetical protein
MIPAAVLSVIEQVLRLINNLIEGTPMEQRRAVALGWYSATWPLVAWAIPADTRKQIEEIMAKVEVVS